MDFFTSIAIALAGATGIFLMGWTITQSALAKDATGGQPLSGVIPVVRTTPLLDRLFGPLLGRLSYRLALLLRRIDKDEARLRAAGYPTRYSTVYDLYAWKVAMALFLFLVGIAASLIAGSSFVFLALGLGLVGMFLPDFQLARLIRKREENMRFEMAFSLHRMAVFCAAGGSLGEAAQQLAYSNKGGVFVNELRQVTADMQKGMTLDEALEQMKERNPNIPEVVTLAELLRASGRTGTSNAEVLRSLGNVMIDKALQEMEQRGIASGVQMVIPVGGLILPAIGIAVMGPGIFLAAQYFLFR